jgi:hypothetical protein
MGQRTSANPFLVFLSLGTIYESAGSIVRTEASRLPGSRQMVFGKAAEDPGQNLPVQDARNGR